MTSIKTRTSTPPAPAHLSVRDTPATRMLALCRILLGFVFIWPALDKSFGLGYGTPPEAAWLTSGKSPAAGYLSHIDSPLSGFFAGMAGPVTDFLFIVGMFCTGAALLLGIGLRVAAVAGALLMMTLWLTQWTFAPGSNNPVVDTHIINTVLVITIAVTNAGDTWGFGRAWAASGIPGTRTWMR